MDLNLKQPSANLPENRRLSIIIVNYRTPDLVLNCLASLQNQIDESQDVVVVVDNASDDGSMSEIESGVSAQNWHRWVRLLQSPDNRGFSSGNNQGIRAIKANAYLLLNSDTIVRPGAIKSLLSALQGNEHAGLLSPRLEWPDGTPQVSCFRFLTPISEFINAAATGPVTKLLNRYNVPLPLSELPFAPEWTSFACVLIRHEVIEQVGFLDEGYFMYYDDVDYCRRARDRGWKVMHWPEARVVHLRGGSGPIKESIANRKRPKRYLYESRSRYFGRFYGRLGCLAANISWLFGRGISLCREVFGNKRAHTCQKAGRDIWTNWLQPMKAPTIPEKNQ